MKVIIKMPAAAWNFTKGSSKKNLYIVVHYVGAGYEVYDQAGTLVYDPGGNIQQYTPYWVVANDRANDSWWSIDAKLMKNGLLMYELAAFNDRNINSSIHPGEILKIPA